MYATVQLLNGFTKPLIYKIPAQLKNHNLVGRLVIVPLQNRSTSALITKTFSNLQEKKTFQIREIIDLHAFPQDALYTTFIEKIAQFYFTKPIHFYQRIQGFIHAQEEPVPDLSHEPLPSQSHTDVTLTKEQQTIITHTLPYINKPTFIPCLIHGVTGSGKTEIYKKMIESCIREKKKYNTPPPRSIAQPSIRISI
ncbi:MAG: hypothetical protein V1855_04635 [bacterium]